MMVGSHPRIRRVLDRLARLSVTGPDSWRSLCPAHADCDPSLAIAVKNGKILMNCHGGCDTKSILRVLGFTWEDLQLDSRPSEIATKCSTPDEEFTDSIYRVLIDWLSLSITDCESLLKRGLSHEAIEENQYRSLNFTKACQALKYLRRSYSVEQLLTIPGVVLENGYLRLTHSNGILIPVRNVYGLIIGAQLRLHKRERKYRWLSSPGVAPSGTPTHVPVRSHNGSAPTTIRITEGPLKADVATEFSDIRTLGVPGVARWRSVLRPLEVMKPKTIHLAVDTDWPEKPQVFEQLRGMVDYLSDVGYEVLVEWWDQNEGKGIDDLLVTGGEPTTFSVEELTV